ncbi:acetyl-CoA hydrolase/transferase C-terminal domain-containing protein [soil metagenome]
MAPIRFQADALASVLPPGGLTLVSSCSAESALLADAVMAAGDALGAMTFSGIFVPGLNRRTWLANPQCRVLTFFMTPPLREAGEAVEFLPLCYADIRTVLRARAPSAALFMVSPPDAQGNCSFGTQVDFIADMWRDIPCRIAHINPAMPATPGDPGIAFAELTGFIEAEQPLLGMDEGPADAAALAIAGHIAPFVTDSATLQTGLGKIPGAVLRALTGRRNLRVHSGLIGDGILDLIDAGAMAKGASATVGVAIGSRRLYDAVGRAPFQFRPVSVTHNPRSIAGPDRLVTINSAIEVDLLGQGFAELTGKGLMSGPGGASDFSRCARMGDGIRVVALPASAAGGTISRIVAPGEGSGPVSLGRMDIDVIVTEHGAADLRGRGYADRARALVALAPPDHRARLETAWEDYARRL